MLWKVGMASISLSMSMNFASSALNRMQNECAATGKCYLDESLDGFNQINMYKNTNVVILRLARVAYGYGRCGSSVRLLLTTFYWHNVA